MLQEVCLKCGWHGDLKPDETEFAGPGGELTCPECYAHKRNRGIEAWGYVRILKVAEDGRKSINCDRCGMFYRLGGICGSASCKKLAPDYRKSFDLDSLPAWLLKV